jgi:hypothetical protein
MQERETENVCVCVQVYRYLLIYLFILFAECVGDQGKIVTGVSIVMITA